MDGIAVRAIGDTCRNSMMVCAAVAAVVTDDNGLMIHCWFGQCRLVGFAVAVQFYKNGQGTWGRLIIIYIFINNHQILTHLNLLPFFLSFLIVYQQYSYHQSMNTSSLPPDLSQLKINKNNILSQLPNPQLADFLNYQQSLLQQSSCMHSFLGCFNSYRYPSVGKSFRNFFQSLPLQVRTEYYANVLSAIMRITNKKTRMPESTSFLQQQSECFDVNVKLEKKWEMQKLRIDYQKKIIELQQKKIDLRHYYLQRRKECYHWNAILTPIIKHLPAIQFTLGDEQFEQLFQRLHRMTEECLEENIINIIEGDCKAIEATSKEEHISSERGLREEKVSIQLHSSRISLQNGQQTQRIDYLKYPHPVAPLQKGTLQLLVPKEDMHYLLQGEYKISEKGELIVCNEEKLEEQSNVIKYIIKRLLSGHKVFSISLPVHVFGPESNLSLLLGSFRFAPLILEPAALLPPLERFKQVIKFSLTCPACYIRCDKPFNPILGETFQKTIDGTLFYGEQISHHPPISAAFVKGRGFSLYGSFEAEVQFGLNSATGNNKGWVKVSFDQHDLANQVVRFTNSPGEMSGLIFGKRTLNLVSSTYFIDEQNYIYCELFFGKVKYQQKVKTFYDSVEGRVVQLNKKVDLSKPQLITDKDIISVYGLIHGQWLSQVFFSGELLINTRKEHPPALQTYPALLQSDYSFREDLSLRLRGPSEQCQRVKQSLEQLQRSDRKLREQYSSK